MGIAEARWTGAWKQRLNSGETIIRSGRQDNKHQEGVALIIASKYANTLLQWKPISQRLLYVMLNARHVKLSIIVAYDPIENADEEDKDNFYYSLQMTVDNFPRHEILLLHGDLNASVGCNKKNRERVMGKHGVGDLTNNGERVTNLCEENNLIIGGTIFSHRNIHKLT